MLKDLIKVSNRLDSLGLAKEADFLDSIIKKLSSNDPSQAELEVLDTSRNVSENYSPSELKLLKSFENLINDFREVLNESYYSEELEKCYEMTTNLSYQVNELINQASFERSIESSSPDVERMDVEKGLNTPWYEEDEGVGIRPNRRKH